MADDIDDLLNDIEKRLNLTEARKWDHSKGDTKVQHSHNERGGFASRPLPSVRYMHEKMDQVSRGQRLNRPGICCFLSMHKALVAFFSGMKVEAGNCDKATSSTAVLYILMYLVQFFAAVLVDVCLLKFF